MKKLFVSLLSCLLFVGISVNAYGFGFKKNNNHQRPDVGIYASELAGTDSYYVGSDEKVIYLTFDAGYDNGNLIKILDILDRKNVLSTFFVTGDFLERNSDLAKEIDTRGHIVGNHTYHHKNITKISEDSLRNEVKLLEDKYRSLTNKEMVKVFRPPEGQFNKASLTVLKDMGYKTFFWSIAYDDWNTKSQKGGDYGYKKVMDNLHNGAIILMHTVSSDNVECLERVIDDARSQGYEFRNLNNFQG